MIQKQTVMWIVGGLLALLVLCGGFYAMQSYQYKQHVKLSAFARCISESGAKFYGAFWCPHCQSQKAKFDTFFNSASKELPYIECSTEDTRGQIAICKDENIKTYPTWKFVDGTVLEGEIPFATLATKTGCALPN